MSTIERLIDGLVAARTRNELLDFAHVDGVLATHQDSYTVQQGVARQMGWFADHFPRYWKSGSPARDAVFTHAALPESGVWNSPANGAGHPFVRREIEAEIALRLAVDVTPEQAQALVPGNTDHLIDAMTVTIEVVDSRWKQGRTVPPLYGLADMQSHGALAVGNWVPYQRRDWATQQCTVWIGAQAPAVFTGTHSLQDPAWVLPAWLQLATRLYGTAPAGTVVTTGTWVGILPAQAGDAVRAEFPGVGQASLQL